MSAGTWFTRAGAILETLGALARVVAEVQGRADAVSGPSRCGRGCGLALASWAEWETHTYTDDERVREGCRERHAQRQEAYRALRKQLGAVKDGAPGLEYRSATNSYEPVR